MYMSFFQDWGPLNVAMVYKACIYIHSLLIVSHSPSYDVWPRTLVWRSDVV
jgi:cell division cycle 14